MNDAEMINQSGYRRAFRYLRNSVQQSSLNSRFSSPSADKDLAAVDKVSNNAFELVFFPSYARRSADTKGELQVNIHGWLFNPVPAGKQSRRNRYTMMLARSIAGLPAMPTADNLRSTSVPSLIGSEEVNRPSTSGTSMSAGSRPHSGGGKSDEARFANGESEGYEFYEHSDGSEPPTPGATTSRANSFPFVSRLADEATGLSSSPMRRQGSSDSQTLGSAKFTRHYSDHDLINCHANLSTRISPFLSKAVTGRSVVIELLSGDKVIASSKLFTSENGHFRGTVNIPQSQIDRYEGLQDLKAQVMDDDLTGFTEIRVVHESGISIISDIDDTVKHTNIVAGVREAFRNAFVRDLYTLEITGVRKWYNSMKELGCSIHYVSNAPYQLWPCIAAFIKVAGLPPGTISLKQYSGFLQGMFEPAAEKKRANVEKILTDFPKRKFLLIGDSGEQDLELYSDLARSKFSKQILGIFIRDVSTSRSSALASPTGETGENFFSKGQGDNIVDSSAGSSGLHTVTEIVSPPRLPARPKPLLDLNSDHAEAVSDATKAGHTTTEKSSASATEAILQAFSLQEPSSNQEASERPVRTSIDPVKPESPAMLKGRPSLPRKPTALKFWSKLEDSSQVDKPASEDSPDKSVLSLSEGPSPTSISRPSTPTSAGKRPGLLRSLSGTAYYGEGRKLTKAQERTQAWEIRLARARALLPDSIKLYVWKEGIDCQQHAEALIKKALKQMNT